jgi:hypothetical protein
MAARRAAVADIALLRERLGLLGEALAGTGAGEVEPGEAADTEAGAPPGRLLAARPGDAAGAEGLPGRETAAKTRSRHEPEPEEAPAAPVTPLPTRPARRRRRRSLPVSLAAFAATAAAFVVVVGLGWLISQEGLPGTMSQDSGSLADDSGAGAAEQKDSKASPEGYVACARLIVEGTVEEVIPLSGTGRDRVTLDVERYYKPTKGADEIVFPMAVDVDPGLKKGDHVLVGIPKNSAEPDLWATSEDEIDRRREMILDALPGAKGLPCE